jgi:large subunit ribosomal protein L22
MEGYAILKNVRISPKKAMRVAKYVAGMDLLDAIDLLKVLPQKSAKLVYKAMKSAMHNLLYQYPNVDANTLYVKKVTIDKGIVYKRYVPMARGRAGKILKRTSHITVVISNE